MTEVDRKGEMGTGLLLLMAMAVSATIANLYYCQPLLPSMGDALGVEEGVLGWIPSVSQMGYAVAILFISPLGDRLNRKSIIRYLSMSLILGLLGTYFASNLFVLLVATFMVGLGANITHQLIPFAASLSSPENRGRVISSIMTGLTLGILLSRTLSGFVGEHWGWRSMFLVASCVAVLVGVLLNMYLPDSQQSPDLPYKKLLLSMFTLVRTQPLLREAVVTGALWFAAFNALWATLAIHVSAEPFSYNVQQAGLLGFVGVSGIFGAKISGRLVSKYSTSHLIAMSLAVVIFGFAVMVFWGDSLTGLIAGIVLVDLGVFGAQIPNQVRIFSIDQSAQSRINAVYMLLYYVGASFGSVAGVMVMNDYGWVSLYFVSLYQGQHCYIISCIERILFRTIIRLESILHSRV